MKQIKVYPLLTHTLKALTEINMGYVPITPRQLERKLLGLRVLFKDLKLRPALLGGYRIEATFRGDWGKMKDAVSYYCSPEGLIEYVVAFLG